jgi:toxin HigB-1
MPRMKSARFLVSEIRGENSLIRRSIAVDIVTVLVTIEEVIRSFKCRDTRKVFNYEQTLRWSEPVRKAALRRLYALDAATNLLDLRSPPSNRLEKLRGGRAGQYSIRINDQWRICFVWGQTGAWDVEIVDYH